MRIVSHPEAEEELAAAAAWYEARQPGLGEEFLEEFERTLHGIQEAPARWRKFQGENRKLNLRRFPYAIVHGLSENRLQVKAVMHLHRRPGYWRMRS